MRSLLVTLLVSCAWPCSAIAQCAPAPDSAYFFRNLSEQRAEAKIADNRSFYDRLLSANFAAKAADGSQVTRAAFIAAELAPIQVDKSRRFYAISNYQLAEHRQGYTVVTYLLREGITDESNARLTQFQLRETYEVIDGRWLLTAVESTPAR